MGHRSLAVRLAPLALALALLGCSGDDDEDKSSDTSAETVQTTETTAVGQNFADALDQLCLLGDDAGTEATDAFQTALDELQVATEEGDDDAYADALADAESATEDIIGAIDSFEADVGELDVPAEAGPALSAFVDSLLEQKALAENLREAIVADDAEAFNDAFTALQDADEESDAERAEAAEELGADECAPNPDPEA